MKPQSIETLDAKLAAIAAKRERMLARERQLKTQQKAALRRRTLDHKLALADAILGAGFGDLAPEEIVNRLRASASNH